MKNISTSSTARTRTQRSYKARTFMDRNENMERDTIYKNRCQSLFLGRRENNIVTVITKIY